MNNKIEVIGIDHGWSNMKTSSQVFTTGVKEITTEPALFDGVLEYKGKYYKVGSSRQEVEVITASAIGEFANVVVLVRFNGDTQGDNGTGFNKPYNSTITNAQRT